jgi:hypothetical protein
MGMTMLVTLAALPTAVNGQAIGSRPITFTRDIAPIFQRSCENCHRAGGIGPMSLTTYEESRPWARAIKHRVSQRAMPPWFIEKNIGVSRFKDDISLSDAEIATIASWVDNGAPRGNPADMPPPRQYNSVGSEWTIGTPDLVVSSPVTLIKAVAPDLNTYLKPVPVGLTEDRYIKAVEFKEVRLPATSEAASSGEAAARPSAALNLFMVHHAIIGATSNPDGGRDRNARDFVPGTFNHAHELGQNATIYPDELGVRLAADSYLTYQVHFHSVGKDSLVRLDAAFKFHPRGYKPKHTLGILGDGRLEVADLDIPAGQENVTMELITVISKPTKLITFEPHMHASGKRMCVTALYPNGVRETVNCAGYNHNWVKVYNYADDAAPLLPPGTILTVVGVYDNSPNNPRVAEPRNWKGYGHRSIDDMFLFLGKAVNLTDEEFKAEQEARASSRSRPATGNQH